VCLAEAGNTNGIVFSLTRLGLERTIYRTRGEHADNYNKYTDAILSWQEQVTSNEIIITALYKTHTLSWSFIVLAPWHNNPLIKHVAPLRHIILMRGNQSFAHIQVVYLAEKQ